MAKHALLSASGASRWLACPPSALLEQKYPDSTSEYAKEGTLAHHIAELKLRVALGEIKPYEFNRAIFAAKKSELYAAEMDGYTDDYVSIVMEHLAAAKKITPDALLLVEQRLDFSPWVPGGFGTGDAVIIADGAVEVLDLKYGKGVPVAAKDNPQARLYGLGAYNAFNLLYQIDAVKTTIVQPRLQNITSEELAVTTLLVWAQGTKATAVLAAQGKGDYKAGDWCRFCRARVECRALAEQAMEMAKHEFKAPDLLEKVEVADILKQAEMFTHWLKGVADWALKKAIDGERYPGLKLVEGKSRRVIADQPGAAHALLLSGCSMETVYKPRELRGITDLTKELGAKKFDKVVGPFIIKPQGAPTLVKETDKRPEWAPQTAAADFAESAKPNDDKTQDIPVF